MRAAVSVTRPARRVARATLAVVVALAPTVAAAFDLQGHRGARGLAPENTLAAFDAALEVGVDTLELDVGVSRDDVLVVTHDRTLNPDIVRDADGRWLPGRGPAVRELDFATLGTFDVGRIRPGSAYAAAHPDQRAADGERMPSLEQLFEHVARRGAHAVRYSIETKLSPLAPHEAADADTFARLVVDAIRRARLTSRASVQSFDWRTLERVRRLAPEIATVFLSSARPTFDTVRIGAPQASPWTAGRRFDSPADVARAVRDAGGRVWSPNAADLDETLVRDARALGLEVVPWTVNEAADMVRLIGWGVDGLITDRPDRLREVMRARGMALPVPVPRMP